MRLTYADLIREGGKMSGRQDRLREVMSGALGVYWCQNNGKDLWAGKHSAGYLRVTPQNLVQVEILLGEYDGAYESFFEQKPPLVTSIVGRTQKEAVYLLDQAGQRSRWTLGGPGLSVGVYRFKCATVGVPLDDLKSDRVREISVQYPDMLPWAGMKALERKWITDSQGRNKRVEYVLDAKEQRVDLKLGGYNLTLQPHWRVERPESDVILSTGLDVKCETIRAKPIGDLIKIVLRVQDLLSIARQGAVIGREGGVRVDLKKDSKEFGENYAMWHRDLMTSNSPAVKGEGDNRPFFTLEDLGGAKGLSRWIKLYGEHPRLMSPIAERWRYGQRSAAAELLECAIAMEYFVKYEKKASGAAWATSANFAVSIAKRVGKPFGEWSSDAEEWGLLFWQTYNAVKHDLREHDPRKVAVMAASGRLALTSFALVRVAGKGAIAARFLNNNNFHDLREAVREYIDSSDLKVRSVRQRRRLKNN